MFLVRMYARPKVKDLLHNERFIVDGTHMGPESSTVLLNSVC